MSRDCLCLMLALCCQDVSTLGRGAAASCRHEVVEVKSSHRMCLMLALGCVVASS